MTQNAPVLRDGARTASEPPTPDAEARFWAIAYTTNTKAGEAANHGPVVRVSFLLANFVVPLVAIAAIGSALFGVGIPFVLTALKLSVIFMFVHALLVMPFQMTTTTSFMNGMVRQVYLVPLRGEDPDTNQTLCGVQILANNAFRSCRIASLVISAIVAFLLHDRMMAALGSPWADLLTMAILVVGFQLGLVLLAKPVRARILASPFR